MSINHRQSALYDLRDRIIRGDLPGGTKLRASHLAEEMGVSRTPISEALLKLEGEGLLISDKSGFTVRSFTLSDVYDAINLRGLLEAAAAQKAAETGIASQHLQRLHDLLNEMDRIIAEDRLAEYDQLNEDFHRALVASSESPILIEEVERSYRFPFAGPSAFPTRDDDRQRFQSSLLAGQEHHRQIVDALESRQGSRIFALVLEHARLAHANVKAALNQSSPPPQLALVKG